MKHRMFTFCDGARLSRDDGDDGWHGAVMRFHRDVQNAAP